MSLVDLQARLSAYVKAETAVLEGNQSYTSPDGHGGERPNLGQLQAEIKRLRLEISCYQGGFGSQPIFFGGRRCKNVHQKCTMHIHLWSVE